MRYKIINGYKLETTNHYIAKCLKQFSPQFVLLECPRTLCKEIDIVDVNHSSAQATWATGEAISLSIIKSSDHLDELNF